MLCKNCGEEKKHYGLGLCHNCYDKQWREKNLDKIKEYNKQWRENNREKDRETKKRWRENNREKDRETHRQWLKKNREKDREWKRIYQLNREHTNIEFKLRMVISKDIRMRIKNQYSTKAYKTMELIGCTIQQFREHIEKQFQPNMTWKNYGNWELHHKIPCTYFILTEAEQQKLCFHYTNYQPLWIEEHRKIRTKILEEEITSSVVQSNPKL